MTCVVLICPVHRGRVHINKSLKIRKVYSETVNRTYNAMAESKRTDSLHKTDRELWNEQHEPS